jgi:transposase InsO family protein
MSMQGNLSIERMCQLASVSRASFYRSLATREAVEEDMEVRSAIQHIFAEHKRRYGYRRVSKELRRGGMPVNHKRVQRLMREDNLLAVQPQAFVITTDSDHDLEVYLNLASRMKLTGVNQLWVADITYIRLHREWVYLAVILDAFSRKVIGWELDRTLAARLPMAALEKAIADRQPPPGVVHHSDRGVQYASGPYVGLLRRHSMIPSMSRPANPYDNASCESFMKTLKREEIYANQYRDLEHSADQHRGVHRSLLQPRAAALRARLPTAGGVRAIRRALGDVARCDHEFFQAYGDLSIRCSMQGGKEPAQTGSPDHRLDESPAGYSSAGCSPAEPASASPAEDYSARKGTL